MKNEKLMQFNENLKIEYESQKEFWDVVEQFEHDFTHEFEKYIGKHIEVFQLAFNAKSLYFAKIEIEFKIKIFPEMKSPDEVQSIETEYKIELSLEKRWNGVNVIIGNDAILYPDEKSLLFDTIIDTLIANVKNIVSVPFVKFGL